MNKLTAAILLLYGSIGHSQVGYIISGKVFESSTGRPLQSATVDLVSGNITVVSKMDGFFRIYSDDGCDTLQVF